MVQSRFLLDTHAFLWWQAGDPRFPGHLLADVASPDNLAFVSAVTCWEIVTKFQLGKLDVPAGIAGDIEGSVLRARMMPLPVTFAHAQRTGSLPYFHKDPFDRLLIAQALIEGLTLISRDVVFDQYGAKRVINRSSS